MRIEPASSGIEGQKGPRGMEYSATPGATSDADHGPGGTARAHRPAVDGRQGPDGGAAGRVLGHAGGSACLVGQRGGPGGGPVGPVGAVSPGGSALVDVSASILGGPGAAGGLPDVPPAAPGGRLGGPGGHPRAACVLRAVGGYLADRHGRKSRMLGVKQGAKASKTQRAGAEKGLFPNDLAECSSPQRVTWPLAGAPGAGGRLGLDGQRLGTPDASGQAAGADNGRGVLDAAGQRAAQGGAGRPPEAPQGTAPSKVYHSVSSSDAPGNF